MEFQYKDRWQFMIDVCKLGIQGAIAIKEKQSTTIHNLHKTLFWQFNEGKLVASFKFRRKLTDKEIINRLLDKTFQNIYTKLPRL